ncbi:Na+/H+ antiporter NhaC family protein [Oceanivirga salmonicida]|uniref:Na+/H+ antiporter NhaC family protein n=1 Tax=Oceanivirga salmonicida TaxID=1769291 RepID=UPI0008309740|nr:Na+/H+ antiporter NhaC family protein [Oceanivirga salmonicida]
MKNIFKLSPIIIMASLMITGYDALIVAPIATIYACVIAVIFTKMKFNDVIEAAISSVKEIQIALFILMVAYALAEVFIHTGVGASVIILALKIGINARLVAVVGAAVTSILSIATGTSWGTFAACAPIFLWLNHIVGGNVALTVAAIAGGSCFGDNIGLISETTIISSGIQDVEIIRRIRHQGVWSILVLLTSLFIFYIFGIFLGLETNIGNASDAINHIPKNVLAELSIKNASSVKLLEQVKNGVPIYMIIPLISVLFLAFKGYQTLICLFSGIITAYILGKYAGTVINLNNYILIVKNGFSSAGNWVIVMMLWISAFGGIMRKMNAFEPISKFVIKFSKSVKQMMFCNGILCILGNAALADEMAQIVTIGPITREIIEDNIEGSEEDMYTLRLRNATFSDAMGVFGSQLIPWHAYIAFYVGTVNIVYPLIKITALDIIKYNFIAIIAVTSILILTLTGFDKYIPLFGIPSEPKVKLKDKK